MTGLNHCVALTEEPVRPTTCTIIARVWDDCGLAARGGAPRPSLIAVAVSAGLLACTHGSDSPVGLQRAAVIHGADDRRDPCSVAEDAFVRVARQGTAALIPRGALVDAPGGVSVRAPSVAVTHDLCRDGPFAEQPAAATCTGVLVAEDLILTAGHCLPAPDECPQECIVFDYEMCDDQGAMIAPDGIFVCAEVVWNGEEQEVPLDLALLRLDRSVPDRYAPVRLAQRPARVFQPVIVAGHPEGLPLKLDAGGQVVVVPEAPTGPIHLTSDTFVGSSGSGVFDLNGRLLAILSQGQRDYEPAEGLGCSRPVRIRELRRDTLYERATPVWTSLQILRIDHNGPYSRAVETAATNRGDGP
ncbi:MAG: serine protease [Myxococcales bacterium]|nr:serine protease [Myxococcales bacterium]